jgi:hypothetical protein
MIIDIVKQRFVPGFRSRSIRVVVAETSSRPSLPDRVMPEQI